MNKNNAPFMEDRAALTCSSCHTIAPVHANFCSQCGREFKEPPLSTSGARQVAVYMVSFFLAPFGLHFALKYIKQPDPKARVIGIVSLVLTVVAITLMFAIARIFIETLYGPYSTLNF